MNVHWTKRTIMAGTVVIQSMPYPYIPLTHFFVTSAWSDKFMVVHKILDYHTV